MDKKIDDLLLEKIGKYGLGIGDAAIKKIALKLKKDYCTEKVESNNDSIIAFRDELEKTGKILEENLKENYYLVSVGGGLLNLNPAICIVKLDEGMVHIIGYAKEGLIKQNTAKNAVNKIAKLLNNMDEQ